MAGESASLRILLIAAALPDHQLWRQAAAKASVPIELEILEVAPAATLLARVRVDICLLDADLSDAQKAILIKAAHAALSKPLVFIIGPKDSTRPEHVDGILAKPGNHDEAFKNVQLCIRAKIPTRVLIVDDSGTMRSIVRKILQASHFAFEIREAAEGQTALELLGHHKFGIVFVDYNMPGLNGFETLAEIKRLNPAVAVVMISSTLDTAVGDRARAAGALAFLKKPFFPADIDATLERYYGLSSTKTYV
jgi:CheY-like chemotaxis protein